MADVEEVMSATWHKLVSKEKTFVALDGTRRIQPVVEIRLLVVAGRIAANNWSMEAIGEPWNKFRKTKESQGWDVYEMEPSS